MERASHCAYTMPENQEKWLDAITRRIAARHGSCNHLFQEWWLETDSNRRHEDFQSSALPTELSSLITTGVAIAGPGGVGRVIAWGGIRASGFSPGCELVIS